MNSFSIIETQDAGAILSVINQPFATVAQEFGFSRENTSYFPAYIGIEVIQRQLAADTLFWGWFSGDALAGTIAIRNVNDCGLFRIERLAVLPRYRHKGGGAALLHHANSMILKRGGTEAEVEIVNENRKLHAWYVNRCGFSPVRVDVYPNVPFTVGVLRKKLCAS